MKFTKAVYGVAFEIFDVATDWLLHQVHKSMQRGMKQ
jgi:hypothetical protein